MRTKTLVLTAASALAGFSALAQVVSVNVVGFINLTVPKGGYALVANQLNATDNKLATVIPSYMDGGQFIKWDNAKVKYSIYSYIVQPAPDYTGWLDDQGNPGNPDWAPGEGAFLFNPDKANDATVTLVGEVPQGTALSVSLPPGYSLVSDVPPLAEDVTAAGLPGVDSEQLIKWNATGPKAQSYSIYNYIVQPAPDYTGWLDDAGNPATPSLAVGEGFFVFNPGSSVMQWTRSFQVAP